MTTLLSPMRAATLILLLLYPLVGSTQTSETILWPIKGQEAGTNILLRPQDLLDHEANYCTLVVGAPEGTEVIAPADGEVTSKMHLTYMSGLYQSSSYGFDDANTFDAMRQKLEADTDVRNPKKFINGSISLKLDDGRKIDILGLRGNIPWRTGQRVKAGTVLGTVSYVFQKIYEPHISIAIDKGGKPIDPMTPFGLQTTFKEAEAFTPPEKLTREQANEDFDFFIQSIHECYPSLRDIITPEREAEFVRDCKAKLDSAEVSFTTLYDIVGDAFNADFLHDSHAWRQSSNPFPNVSQNFQYPAIMLCTLGDRIFVRQVQPGYEEHIGKEVASINGLPAKEHVAHIRSRTSGFDAKVESTCAIQMLANWWSQYDDTFGGTGAHVTFTDGTSAEVPYLKREQLGRYTPQPAGPVAYYAHQSQNRREEWSFKMISDGIALLTLGNFLLNDVQMDNIADSLRAHVDVPNLIIDVRDNFGGDADCEERLLKMFLFWKPLTFDCQMVNSNTTYSSFAHSFNWSAEMEPFRDFIKIEGKEGYYNHDISNDAVVRQPNDAIYRGKLFVLTNENSISAATDFPAHLVRAGRAVTIGRETATAYHYMTAMKFARLFLPNTHIEYQLPLVKAITATEVSERFPYGRGLLPDYEVPLTQDEVFFSTEDIILKRALEIIQTHRDKQHKETK